MLDIEKTIENVIDGYFTEELCKQIRIATKEYLKDNTQNIFIPACKLAMEELMERSQVMNYVVARAVSDIVQKELQTRINVSITEKKGVTT